MIFNSLLDRPLAQTLWDYHKLKHALKPADFMLLVCSYDLDVADYADILFMQKMVKFIVISGGSTDRQGMARMPWEKPEHMIFKKRLMELGGKEEDIVVEESAMTLSQSIHNTRDILLSDPEADYKTGFLVVPPHLERRAFATASHDWPEITWQVTSPKFTYDDYINKFDEESLIHLLVGETQRVIKYAEEGFIVPQEMPENVQQAYKKLLDKGYTKQLIKED